MRSQPEKFSYEKALDGLIAELILIVQKERALAGEMKGEGMEELLRQKRRATDGLLSAIPFVGKLTASQKSKLKLLSMMNATNTRLFQNILRLSTAYKKILGKSTFDSVTYTKKGLMARIPKSVRFVGAA